MTKPARSRVGFGLLAFAVCVVSTSAVAAGGGNPYLEPASRLYQSLEFNEALRTLEKALKWPSNTPEEDIRAAVLEGLITAQLGKSERAESAFKRALAMDPSATLPFKVSPKISRLFEKARAQMGIQEGPAKAVAATTSSQTAPATQTQATPPEPASSSPTTPAASATAPATSAPGATASTSAASAASPATPAPKVSEAAPAQPEAPKVAAKAEAAPEKKGHGLLGGVLGFYDVLGASKGLEPFIGYHFGRIGLSARVRPGRLLGVGLLGSVEHDFGPIVLFGALRADAYLGAGTPVPGLGAAVGVRRGLVGPLALTGQLSGELYRVGAVAGLRPFAAIVSAGLEVRL